MKKSPFIYGITVSSGAFTNREKECQKLKNNIELWAIEELKSIGWNYKSAPKLL